MTKSNIWDDRFDQILLNSRIYRERHAGHIAVRDILGSLKKQFSVQDEKFIFVGYTDSIDRILFLSDIEENVIAIADPSLHEYRVDARVKRIRGIKTISVEEATKYNNVIFVFVDNDINKATYNDLLSIAKKTSSLYDIIADEGGMAIRDYNYLLIPYATSHEKIMLSRRKYETALNDRQKKCELIELIYLLLEVKDFVYSFKYMDEYISLGLDEDDEVKSLKQNLDCMLEELKNSLMMRKNDFIFIWNDGLRFDELRDLDYLGQKIKPNSLFFENAFSTVFDTRGVYGSVFNKRMQLDDYMISDDDCDLENSLFMKSLENHGCCKLITYSDPNLSNKENTTTKDLLEAGSLKLWDGITKLEQCNENAFLFVHELAETHEPCHCPQLDKDYYYIRGCRDDDYQKHLTISRRYWDCQLNYYMSFLEYDNIKLFMSDHGKHLSLSELITPNRNYLDEFTHVVLMLTGKNIVNKSEKRLFSLYNMVELVDAILSNDKDKYDNVFSEYIKIQSIDRYNIGDINRKLADGTKKRDMMAFRAVRTNEDMYVLIANGEEEYYLLPDFNNDLIDDDAYKRRIKYLRGVNGDYFLDINNIDFFEGARILYDSRRLKEI